MFSIFHRNRRQCLIVLKGEADNAQNSLAERAATGSHAVDVYLQRNPSKRQAKLDSLLRQSTHAGAETQQLAEISCAHALDRPRVEALIEGYRQRAHVDVETAHVDRALQELNVAKSVLSTASFEAPDIDRALDAQIAETQYAADQLMVAELCGKGTSFVTAEAFDKCLATQRMIKARGFDHPSASLVPTIWDFLKSAASFALTYQSRDIDSSLVPAAAESLCADLDQRAENLDGNSVVTAIVTYRSGIELESDRAKLAEAKRILRGGDSKSAVGCLSSLLSCLLARDGNHASKAYVDEVENLLQGAAAQFVTARLANAQKMFAADSTDVALALLQGISADVKANIQWRIKQETRNRIAALEEETTGLRQSRKDAKILEAARALLESGQALHAMQRAESLTQALQSRPSTHASRSLLPATRQLELNAFAALPDNWIVTHTQKRSDIEQTVTFLARLDAIAKQGPNHANISHVKHRISSCQNFCLVAGNPQGVVNTGMQFLRTGDYARAHNQFCTAMEVRAKLPAGHFALTHLQRAEELHGVSQCATRVTTDYEAFRKAQADGNLLRVLELGTGLQSVFKVLPADAKLGIDEGARRGLLMWDIENSRLDTFALMLDGVEPGSTSQKRRAAIIALAYLEGPAAMYSFTRDGQVFAPVDLTKHTCKNMKNLIAAGVPKERTQHQTTVKIAQANLQLHSELQSTGIGAIVLTVGDAFAENFRYTASSPTKRKAFYEAFDWACVEAQLGALGDTLRISFNSATCFARSRPPGMTKTSTRSASDVGLFRVLA